MSARGAAPALLAALAVAGCAAGGPGPAKPPAAPEPSGTGYFVGRGSEGVGVSLDLLGEDPVTRAVDAALAARGAREAAVGIVSVVNGSRAGIGMPRFTADLAAGGSVPLTPAADAIAGEDGPAAARARRMLARLPRRVPAEGAGTAYVVLAASTPAAVGSVRMVDPAGRTVTLAARRR